MAFKSKYTGAEVESILDIISQSQIGGFDNFATKADLENKQDVIQDIDAIRSGAAKGATALQSVPSEYVTETELSNKGYATISALNNKVDAINGKQLSTEDFTTTLKDKLEGLNNYDDTELSEAIETLRGDFDNIVSGDTTTAIKTFNEVIAFLDGLTDTQDLESIIASIEQQIAGKMDKVTLAKVATSGSYNDLSNKPTIPAAVTESTVSGWGFTKNTGTYIKPSGGIPKSDLASAVQTSLGKADTALQSYIEQYKGTVTGVKINGEEKSPNASGVVDLGETEKYATDKSYSIIIDSVEELDENYSDAPIGTMAIHKPPHVEWNGNLSVFLNSEDVLEVFRPFLLSHEWGCTLTINSIDTSVELPYKMYEPDDIYLSFPFSKKMNMSVSKDLTSISYIDVVRGFSEEVYTDGVWIGSNYLQGISISLSELFGSLYSEAHCAALQLLAPALTITVMIDKDCIEYIKTSEGWQLHFSPFAFKYLENALPTKTSQLKNDSNFVSSDNIKTINGQSILGEGDITIEGGSSDANVQAVAYNFDDWMNEPTRRSCRDAVDLTTGEKIYFTGHANYIQCDDGMLMDYIDDKAAETRIIKWDVEAGPEVYMPDEVTEWTCTQNGILILNGGVATIVYDEDSGTPSIQSAVVKDGVVISTQVFSGILGGPEEEVKINSYPISGGSGGSIDTSNLATKDELAQKQDIISDIDTIRTNAANYKGTVNGVIINGISKSPSSGIVDLGYINKQLSTTTASVMGLSPNIYYRNTSTTLSSLTIILGSVSNSNIINEYFVEFTTSSSGTTISLPSTIKWANCETPTFEAGCTYQISIVNNLGIVTKFK